MLKFILFILIIFLIILFLGIGFMTRFVRIFTKRPGDNYNRQSRSSRYQDNNPDNSPDNKKVFSKDEGEYVDYEEIEEAK